MMKLSTNNMSGIRIRNNRGFTLLEALLGFLILSVGMLGIASLQAVSLKAGKTSVYGSVAMMKVAELFESMRANPTDLAIYEGSGSNNSCTGSANCSAAQLAQDDLYWWGLNLKAGLPGAATTAVSVTLPAAASASKMATVKVDITWQERNKDGAGSVDKTYTTSTNICTDTPC